MILSQALNSLSNVSSNAGLLLVEAGDSLLLENGITFCI